jgi:MFS transporter, PAT family, beta-lactamase induction signal transducer AmpG
MTTSATSLSEQQQKSSNLPSLSEHTFLRYLSFSVLYVAQGIPEGMTFFGIPAWMAMNGKSAAEIGSFVAVVGIPWSLKILIAPLMDRFTFLAMGRRRPWVIVGQLGLIISFIAMAFVPDPLNNIRLLMAAGFMISFFGAFQDVAVDGMAIDIVPIDQQARANGLMWGAKTIGISASLALGNWIIHSYGFQYAVLCLSAAISVIIFMPLFLRERPGEKILPWSRGSASAINLTMQLESWSQIFKSLVKVFFLPGSLLMGMAFFIIQMGFGLLHTLLPVFTIQAVGWTDQEYAHVFSITSIVAGFLGMFAGGALADLYGKNRMMTIYLVCMILLVAAMAFLKIYWSNAFLVTGFIGCYITLWVFLSVAVFATGMELCWKRVAATQFTLYMAISNLGKAIGSGLLGPLHKVMPWEYVILSFAGFAIVMLILVQFLRLQKHLDRIQILEQDHLENEAVMQPVLMPVAEFE